MCAPPPAQGSITGHTRIVDLVDKGADKGTLLYLEKTITDDATGTVLASVDRTVVLRGDGDTKPLHAEPDIARAADFERPILHGLFTFDLAATTALFELADGDVKRLRSFYARFSAPAYPGKTLLIKIWRDAQSHAHAEILPDD